jgi:acyl carrier protein
VTAIGKIDRRALPAPDGARPELESAFVAPCTAVEEVLAEMWAQLLGFKQIGIHDNFFELGGHSLLATQFISRLRDAFAVEVPLSRLLEAPTVAALAAALLEGADERARIEKTALRLLEVARLSEAQAGRILDEKSALDKTGRTQ